jgi:hypothetical protein
MSGDGRDFGRRCALNPAIALPVEEGGCCDFFDKKLKDPT